MGALFARAVEIRAASRSGSAGAPGLSSGDGYVDVTAKSLEKTLGLRVGETGVYPWLIVVTVCHV